jgi:L,D-peptidoglycan transpeptidase YkuD (ErfK/YbiS/YcfS/YnhG family)
MRYTRIIAVRGRSAAGSQGALMLGSFRLKCALGRSGRRVIKREGDGASPIGEWRLVEVLYRADRVLPPRTILPVRRLRPDSGWCDAIGDRNYNREVRHPYASSAEKMWRDDHLYDLVVVLAHNRIPRVQGAGSAIFIHLARPGYTATEGCVALSEHDLRRVLALATRGTRLRILP